MGIKDILVHVDTSPAVDPRLHVALRLARRFDAHVTAAFILPAVDVLALADSGPVTVQLAAYLATLREDAAAAEKSFVKMLRPADVQGEWRTESGSAAASLTRLAQAADLVVLRQRDPENLVEPLAPEDVILACGRPALIVPRAGSFDHVGETVLVGWNGSREATRAIHDGLPLLASSGSITLLSATRRAEDEGANLADLTGHLARHGFHVEREQLTERDADVASTMNARAAALGADMIVMGAYGHSRLREMILGGTTQAMLRHITVPTLMAH